MEPNLDQPIEVRVEAERRTPPAPLAPNPEPTAASSATAEEINRRIQEYKGGTA